MIQGCYGMQSTIRIVTLSKALEYPRNYELFFETSRFLIWKKIKSLIQMTKSLNYIKNWMLYLSCPIQAEFQYKFQKK